MNFAGRCCLSFPAAETEHVTFLQGALPGPGNEIVYNVRVRPQTPARAGNPLCGTEIRYFYSKISF
jgi:hypothetical protein